MSLLPRSSFPTGIMDIMSLHVLLGSDALCNWFITEVKINPSPWSIQIVGLECKNQSKSLVENKNLSIELEVGKPVDEFEYNSDV